VDHFHAGQVYEFEHPLVGAQAAEAVQFMHVGMRLLPEGVNLEAFVVGSYLFGAYTGFFKGPQFVPWKDR
jgi:hypothetical protein